MGRLVGWVKAKQAAEREGKPVKKLVSKYKDKSGKLRYKGEKALKSSELGPQLLIVYYFRALQPSTMHLSFLMKLQMALGKRHDTQYHRMDVYCMYNQATLAIWNLPFFCDLYQNFQFPLKLKTPRNYPAPFGRRLVELFPDLIHHKAGIPTLPNTLPSAQVTFSSLDYEDNWPEADIVSVCRWLRGGTGLCIPSSFRDFLPRRLWSSFGDPTTGSYSICFLYNKH